MAQILSDNKTAHARTWSEIYNNQVFINSGKLTNLTTQNWLQNCKMNIDKLSAGAGDQKTFLPLNCVNVNSGSDVENPKDFFFFFF